MRQGVRPLGSADLEVFLTLARRDPVARTSSRSPGPHHEPRAALARRKVWGRFSGGDLIAACHVGANLVPIEADEDDARAFAERAMTRMRSVSTIVGPHDAVRTFWNTVAGTWGRPREIRWQQPHLQISGPPLVAPDPGVRRTDRQDLPARYPACVAMYTEEVGVSPEVGGKSDLYRAGSPSWWAGVGRSPNVEDGKLLFKAEVACATPDAAQIQGVWVTPERRGEGLGVAGMAAVAALSSRASHPPSRST